jgi:hypothetical protein
MLNDFRVPNLKQDKIQRAINRSVFKFDTNIINL